MVVPLTFFGLNAEMQTDKATMRREYRQKRDEFVSALTDQDRQIAFSRMPSPLSVLFNAGNIVTGYIAIDSEPSPAALLAAAHERGCITALPHVTSRSAPMRFLQWNPGDPLEAGPFGLLQPLADSEAVWPDVVLVPLVAFDSRLMRLGQGAGHYDRALSVLPARIAVGIAWSVQHAPAIDADPWDVPMDAILTEKSWMTL
jgi:5-formyltetrahydrofolate cyclo-ligase